MKSSPYAAQVSAYLDVTFYENISSFPLLPPASHNKLAWRRHKAGLEFSFYFEFTVGWAGWVLSWSTSNVKYQIFVFSLHQQL